MSRRESRCSGEARASKSEVDADESSLVREGNEEDEEEECSIEPGEWTDAEDEDDGGGGRLKGIWWRLAGRTDKDGDGWGCLV